MEWIFKNLWILPVLFFAFSIVKAMLGAKETRQQHEAGKLESEEHRRTREVQERIRRRIAERSGNPTTPTRMPPPLERPAPVARRDAPPPVDDPFGRLGRRVLDELERTLQPKLDPPAPVAHANRAEVERQEQLAEQLRTIEETKVLTARRAAHATADRVEVANAEPAQRTMAREELLADLANGRSLRRAFVLREVLGPPVGLR